MLGLYGSVVDVMFGSFATPGVSTAAGLNAYLPLLLLAILSRSTDLIELSAPWNQLEEPWALAVIGGVALLDFVGDKIAPIDHVLHAAGLAIAPATGAVAAAAAAGVVDVDPAIAVTIGFVATLLTHAGRSAARPVSTLATGGAGNAVVSLAEDGTSGLLTVLAFVAPVLAFLMVVLIAMALVWGVRRWRALGRRLDGMMSGRGGWARGQPPP